MASLTRLVTRDYWQYPQTWYFMPHWKPLRKTLQWLHGLIGHEPSDTEWGYGGGATVDCWCRWCDKKGHIPLDVARKKWKTLRRMELQGFFNDIRSCGTNSDSGSTIYSFTHSVESPPSQPTLDDDNA